ncbi:hypothetical protein [Streptomyces sp. NPDC053431]|uniref:hypothetical protein n=1 Tax=Streptomyces sp. NPDC053431 TaxID=3365703 RepID=UPI0037D843FB
MSTRSDPEARARWGPVAGRLWRGCLSVLIALLVLVVGFWIWLATLPGRSEAKARDALRASVEAHRQQLVGAAADGTVTDAEIARLFLPAKPAPGLVAVTRREGTTGVVAGLLGIGPGSSVLFATETYVTGCFAFDVTVPVGENTRVTSRELPWERCTRR